jgi:hypothetical protein
MFIKKVHNIVIQKGFGVPSLFVMFEKKKGYLALKDLSTLDCLALMVLINQASFSIDMQCLHFLYEAIPVVHPPAKLSSTISHGFVKISTSPPIRNSGFSVGWFDCLYHFHIL